MDTTAKVIVVVSVLLSTFGAHCQDPFCNDKLVHNLPDDHLTASSSKSESSLISTPAQARLNSTEQTLNNGTTLIGAWAPAKDGPGQYVQAMFDEMTMVSGIQTQGRNQGSDHVTLFKVEYTEDGKTWQTVNNDIGVEQIFMGNSDGDSIQDNPLPCPIFAKGIRIVPLEWDKNTALRFEATGCYVDNTVVVVTTPGAMTIITTPITTNATTPFMPGIQTPFGLTTNPTLLTTPTKSLTTKTPSTTVNLLTLIHWFMTHINNNTSPTTPVTPFVTSTTTTATTPTTVITTPTTTPYVFHPGIANPFGTTKSGGALPPIIG